MRIAIQFLVCLALLPGSFQLFAADEVTPEQQKLEAIKAQIQLLTEQVQTEQQQRDSETRLLKETDERIAYQSILLDETTAKMAGVYERTQRLESRQKPLQKQLQEQRENLSKQVSATWRMGRQQYLKLLLNQEDPARLSRILTYYNYLNRMRVAAIERIRQSYQELAELNRQLAAERQQLELYLADQNRILAELDTARREQKEIVEHWDKVVGSAERQLKQLREDAQTLDQLLKQIDKAIPEEFRQIGAAPISALKGKLLWPVKGRVSKSYGARLAGDVTLEGVIISLPEGKPVRAIHGGTVVFSDWLRGYGMLIIVEHDQGYMSLYGYNQRLLKSVGDEVDAGETVSLSGSSGGHQQAALYFAIRKGASSMNPAHWCRATSRGKVG